MGVPPRGCGVWRDDQQGGFRGATTRGGGGAPRFGSRHRAAEEEGWLEQQRGDIRRSARRHLARCVAKSTTPRYATGAWSGDGREEKARSGLRCPSRMRSPSSGRDRLATLRETRKKNPGRFAFIETALAVEERKHETALDAARRRAYAAERRRKACAAAAVGVRFRIRRRIRRRAALRAPRVRGGPGRSGLQKRPARGDKQRYDAGWRPRGRPRRVLRSRIARRNDGEGNARGSRSVARRRGKRRGKRTAFGVSVFVLARRPRRPRVPASPGPAGARRWRRRRSGFRSGFRSGCRGREAAGEAVPAGAETGATAVPSSRRRETEREPKTGRGPPFPGTARGTAAGDGDAAAGDADAEEGGERRR